MLASPYERRESATYESTIAQCSLSNFTFLLGKRTQRLECRELETSSRNDESRFQLLNADARLRIWYAAHEAMDPAWQVGTVHRHGGSIMV
ncbi:hypothetical protein TNCV_4210901 [Trichonephila clavipes]|nr:hypothetical protein TNCV_4210901 [Trichonephila clavipes]